MKTALAVLLVILAAAPAYGRELMTSDKTPVHEKPKDNSAVLTTLAANVRVTSDKRKDNWFRVTVEVDGKEITGWVGRKHVTDMMGRSKGQLLAENRRLYAEVVDLRKTTAQLRKELAEAGKKLETTEADLKKARAEIDLLKAGRKAEAKTQ